MSSIDSSALLLTPKSPLVIFDPTDEVDWAAIHRLGQTQHPAKTSCPLTQKRVFTASNFKLTSGDDLDFVQFGYECFGTLNSDRSNAILIPHYYTGSSHCAGRYAETDVEPGYWDKIIGPGRAIDTNRFFVIGVDALCNVNSLHPFVASTGPTSLNPQTKRPYLASFPWIRLTDTVRAHKRLIDALGIKTLHAVVGPSMGSMLALEWAAEYPNSVQSIIGVIGGSLSTHPYLIQELRQWCAPILLDSQFQNGNYALDQQPRLGLSLALERVTHSARSPHWASAPPSLPGPVRERPQFPVEFPIEDLFAKIGYERSLHSDANCFLRTARAVQRFSVRDRLHNIRSRVLWIYATSDLLLFPDYAKQGILELRSAGASVQTAELNKAGGHLDGIFEIDSVAGEIASFLES